MSPAGYPSVVATLSVLAVDDEPPALDELAYLLRADELVGEVRTAADATAALRLLQSGSEAGVVDVVFLDIRMPGLDGLELARVLSAFADPPAVVFVSAHDDRAVDAYNVGAVDYLLKPLSAERLAESLRRIHRLRSAANSTSPGIPEDVIPVELGGTTTLVPRSAVRWVEAQGDYTRLHTLTGNHLVRIPLSVLEERWRDAGFLRVHRSYLVALPLVTELRMTGNGYVVRLDQRGARGAVELPVSRRHTRELRDRLVRTVKQSWTTR
ncbi:MAG: LytR/AlgR family response regulator transcription factor [Mycobacteriaceae bacterium]